MSCAAIDNAGTADRVPRRRAGLLLLLATLAATLVATPLRAQQATPPDELTARARELAGCWELQWPARRDAALHGLPTLLELVPTMSAAFGVTRIAPYEARVPGAAPGPYPAAIWQPLGEDSLQIEFRPRGDLPELIGEFHVTGARLTGRVERLRAVEGEVLELRTVQRWPLRGRRASCPPPSHRR